MANSISTSLQQAGTALFRGLRDAVHPRLLLWSLGLWLISAMIWLLLAVFFWSSLSGLIDQAGQFLAHGLWSWLAPPAKIIDPATIKTTSNWLSNSLFALIGWGIIKFVLLSGFFLAAVMLTSRLLLEFMLMPLVQKQVLPTYPQLTHNQQTTWHSGIFNALRDFILLILGGLACLLVPILGGLLLFVLLSWLNVRALANDALEGVASPSEIRWLRHNDLLATAILGTFQAGFMLIPVLNVLGPILIGTSSTHFFFLRLQQLRGRAIPLDSGNPID